MYISAAIASVSVDLGREEASSCKINYNMQVAVVVHSRWDSALALQSAKMLQFGSHLNSRGIA